MADQPQTTLRPNIPLRNPMFEQNGDQQVVSRPWIAFLQSLFRTFRVNGVNNGNQLLLDMKAGTGVTLTDDGHGVVTIDATGGGSGGGGAWGFEFMVNGDVIDRGLLVNGA